MKAQITEGTRLGTAPMLQLKKAPEFVEECEVCIRDLLKMYPREKLLEGHYKAQVFEAQGKLLVAVGRQIVSSANLLSDLVLKKLATKDSIDSSGITDQTTRKFYAFEEKFRVSLEQARAITKLHDRKYTLASGHSSTSALVVAPVPSASLIEVKHFDEDGVAILTDRDVMKRLEIKTLPASVRMLKEAYILSEETDTKHRKER